MATDIKISELIEITSNKTINQLIVNDRANSSDAGITKRISISNLLPTYDSGDANKRAIVGNAQLISSAQSPGSEAVDTNVIRDNAITTAKIASGSVIGTKIAGATIEGSNIAANTIQGSNISTSATVQVESLNATSIQGTNIQGTNLNITGPTTFNTKQYNWPASYTASRYLQVDAGGNLSWQQPVAGSGTTFVYDDVLPVGSILPWASNSTPTNYLICDGSTFDGRLYPSLSAILLDTYGLRNGNNFKLPNLKGKIPVGAGTNIPDLSGNTQTFTLGTSGGEYVHKLTIAEMPSHSHDILCKVSVDSGGSEIPPTDSKSSNTYYPTLSTGGDQSHNNIQPYVVTNYIIKAKPDPKVDFGLTIGAGLSANTSTGNINLSGGTIRVKVDNTTIAINGTDQLSVKTGGISGQQLTGQQTGSAPIFGARAWVNFGFVSSTLITRASGNVASVTRNTMGLYSIVFQTPLPDNNYTVIGTAKNLNTTIWSAGIVSTGFYRASGCIVNITGSNSTAADFETINVVVFG
jgi:microcystin-dependent protein